MSLQPIDSTYDPFSTQNAGFGPDPAPSVQDLINKRNLPPIPDHFKNSTGINTVGSIVPVSTPSTIKPQAVPPKPLSIWEQLGSLESSDLEKLAQVAQEVALKKKYKETLGSYLSEGHYIKNILNNQILCILEMSNETEVIYVLDSKENLDKVFSSTNQLPNIQKASKNQLLEILGSWYNDIQNSYIQHLHNWASYLGAQQAPEKGE